MVLTTLLIVVLAHHSAAATYDAARVEVVRGVVASFAWRNPHCHVYISVTEGEFSGRLFNVELGSPLALAQAGWTKSRLLPGDRIEISVLPARSGAPAGLCRDCPLRVERPGSPAPHPH